MGTGQQAGREVTGQGAEAVAHGRGYSGRESQDPAAEGAGRVTGAQPPVPFPMDKTEGAQMIRRPAREVPWGTIPASFWGECSCGWYTKVYAREATAEAHVQRHLSEHAATGKAF